METNTAPKLSAPTCFYDRYEVSSVLECNESFDSYAAARVTAWHRKENGDPEVQVHGVLRHADGTETEEQLAY